MIDDMMHIPFSPPDVGEAEIEAIAKVLRSGWITTGPQTKELEACIAAFCGTNRAVCLNSATAAMELTLRILGIGPGDEVITTAYTYTASCSIICHVGATPIMVDTSPGIYEMDYDALEAAITEKTKAIISVDIGGTLCDYPRMLAAAERKRTLFAPNSALQASIGRIAIIADAAHALGAYVRGGNGEKHMCGTLADFTSFSFHAVKNVTTAEGGALTWRNDIGLDDEEIYHLFMLYSLHGQSKDALSKTKAGAWEYDILLPGYKCNMTDILAVIGLVQMQRYGDMFRRRHEIVKMYDGALNKIGVQTLRHTTGDKVSSAHLYLARIPGADEARRDRLIEKMAQRGVATNVHYKPLPMMTAYKNLGFNIADFPQAFAMYENEITLPLYSRMTDEQARYVIDTFTDVLTED
jgi:dTDP-4-amino-4,6-dideoxygalactose transaminase